MNIFCFTNKGANSKINTDTILFNSEAISGNPLIINEQNNYSHFINSIEGSALGLIADGLGDNFASKLAVETYKENFCKDTVESSHAEQTISPCIGRTDIIWIYIIW